MLSVKHPTIAEYSFFICFTLAFIDMSRDPKTNRRVL
jgi:hypothetical protein